MPPQLSSLQFSLTGSSAIIYHFSLSPDRGSDFTSSVRSSARIHIMGALCKCRVHGKVRITCSFVVAKTSQLSERGAAVHSTKIHENHRTAPLSFPVSFFSDIPERLY